MIITENHKLARDAVSCPACKVKAGYPCRNTKGRNRVHPSRLKAWKNPDTQKQNSVLRSEQRAAKIARKKKRAKDQAFYASWEWKQVRYEALKLHGRRCQCCGWSPGQSTEGYLVVDHIQPRSSRPELALEVNNLQVLCNDCNMGKSNVHVDDFRTAGGR